MPKKALIHIGMPKTGSTSIQLALSFAAQSTGLGNIAYPEFDAIFQRAQHYLELFYVEEEFQQPHYKQHAKKLGIDISNLHKKFLNNLTAKDGVILSSESLSSSDSKRRIQLLKRDLDSCGYLDYKIVAYVREPVSHYISWLQEFLQMSRYCVQPSSHSYLAHARKVIESFSDVFECEVCVRDFDRKNLIGNNIISDFAMLTSQFFDAAVDLKQVWANKALSAEAAFIVHGYRSASPFSDADELVSYKEEVESVLEQLSSVEKTTTKISLHEEVKNILITQNIDEFLYFKEKYDIDYSYLVEGFTPSFQKKPLRLEEIIVKPDDENLVRLRGKITFPRPQTNPEAFRGPGSQLIQFLKNKQHARKVLYGGGAFFLHAVHRALMLEPALKFDQVELVDQQGGQKSIGESLLVFKRPDEIEWNAIDAVLICAPAFHAEIEQHLLSKNDHLSISELTAS